MSQLAVVSREVGGRVRCHDCVVQHLCGVNRTGLRSGWCRSLIGSWLYNDAQRVIDATAQLRALTCPKRQLMRE